MGEVGTRNEIHHDWQVPIWFKTIFIIASLSLFGILIRALIGDQDGFFGIPLARIMATAASLFILCLTLTIILWFYPESGFSIFFYWLTRLLREHIYVLALVGILYLGVLRVPLISVRGAISYLILTAVFTVGCLLKPTDLDQLPHPALGRIFTFINRVSAGVEKISPVWVQLGISLLPIAVVIFVIYFVFDSRLSNYGPYSFWNDEISYWIWLRSFVQAGFGSGYNAPNEILSAFEFSRYGEASPFYLYIYGTIGKLAGWHPALPVLINFALLAITTFLFVRLLRLDNWQTIYTGIALVFTWPVLLYLPITSHEILNQVIGIGLTIAVVKIIRTQDPPGVWGGAIVILFVFFGALVRLSWGLMLIPFVFYSLRGNIIRRGILTILLGGGLFAFAVVLMGYFLPPINNSIFSTLRSSLTEGSQILPNLIFDQLALMFKRKELNPNMATLLQMGIIIGWGVAYLWVALRSKHSIKSILHHVSLFELYSVSSLLVAGLTFYLQIAFYRTFAPALLMIYLLHVVRKDYKRLSSLLMINLIFFIPYMNYYFDIGDYQIVKSDYTQVIQLDEQDKVEIHRHIVFDSTVESPWCNTILIPLWFYDSRLISIPAGIGISYIQNWETYHLPIHSRYVLFDDAAYEALHEPASLKLLASLSIGDLYLNKGVDCPR